MLTKSQIRTRSLAHLDSETAFAGSPTGRYSQTWALFTRHAFMFQSFLSSSRDKAPETPVMIQHTCFPYRTI